MARRRTNGSTTAEDDRSPFVCPFCGRTYDRHRRRCAACGGLPVVGRGDRRVYETVVGPCGSRCQPSTTSAGRPPPRPR